MTNPPRKSTLTVATTVGSLLLHGVPTTAHIAAAAATTQTIDFSTCPSARTIPKWGSTLSSRKFQDWKAKKYNNDENENNTPPNPNKNEVNVEEFISQCQIWPLDGPPIEHLDTSCDRAQQNMRRAAYFAEASELLSPEVVFNLPEEKTWICPLEDNDEGVMQQQLQQKQQQMKGKNKSSASILGTGLGQPTKWILYNEATTPIIISHINQLGYEVSSHDFSTLTSSPTRGNTAVHPHGPVVLPGQMAVVEGRQGQSFLAREFREDFAFDSFSFDNNESNVFNWGHSDVMKIMRNVIPPTWSFGQREEGLRFETNKGVMHVMGHPGRVLMKHRMGLVFVKNEFGAMCPDVSGRILQDVDDGRKGNPTDIDPDCNVMEKGFINKVGCPIDIYFAPPTKDPSSTYKCELYSNHLGSIESFSQTPFTKLGFDARHSPVKFENTYNSHVFIARMSHDQSLVARMEFDHDIVRDCPDKDKRKVGVNDRESMKVQESIVLLNDALEGSFVNFGIENNATKSVGEWNVLAVGNVTASVGKKGSLSEESYSNKKEDIWRNETKIRFNVASLVAS